MLQKPPTTRSHLSKPSESCRGKGQIVTNYAVGFPGAIYFLELLTCDFHVERFIDEMKFHLAGGARTKEPWHAASGAAPITCWHTAVGLESYRNGSVLGNTLGPRTSVSCIRASGQEKNFLLTFTSNPRSSLTGITSRT